MPANITTEVKTLATGGASLTGDQVVASVEEILQAGGIGVWEMVAKPNQVNGSTFSYKLPDRLIPQTYARSTTGISLASGAKVDQVDIVTTNENIVAVEFETNAFATQILADAEKTRIANSMISSLNGHLDIEFFDLLSQTTVAPVMDLGLSKAHATQDELAQARIDLGYVIAGLEGTVSPHELGVDNTREVVILSPKAYWGYLNAFDTNVLEQSQEIRAGNLVMRVINGALIVKHPLIGQNIAAGDIHKTKALDLSKYDGFVMVDVAAAMPVNFIEVASRKRNQNFNPELAIKYKFGKGLLRDKLIVPLKIT